MVARVRFLYTLKIVNIMRLLRKYIRESLLQEYVVPMGFSLSSWKAHKKKHKISNADYNREHPGKKWKVVHGHKQGKVGKPLPGLNKVSYSKANKAHSAVVMSKK